MVHVMAFENAAGFGGAFVDLMHIAFTLQDHGVQVSIAHGHDGPHWDPLRERGITLLPHRRPDVSGWLWEHGYPRLFRRAAFAGELATVWTLQGLPYTVWARKHGVTHVFANNGNSLNAAGVVVAKLLRLPLYTYIQGLPSGARSFNRLSHLTDFHFCVSDLVRTATVAAGIPEDNTATLYPGIEVPDAPAPRPEGRRIRLGMAGMLMPWKGQLEFLDAFALLARQRDDVDATLFGRMPSHGQATFRQQVLDKIAALGLQQRVELVEDRLHPSDIFPHMDIAVHCSILPEPFGRVVIEAMSYGLPVVAAPGGPTEVIDEGVTGYLVPPTSTALLAERLEALCADPALRHAMGDRARAVVMERFRYPNVLLPLFEKLGVHAESHHPA